MKQNETKIPKGLQILGTLILLALGGYWYSSYIAESQNAMASGSMGGFRRPTQSTSPDPSASPSASPSANH
jgi:hypothetical protein